MDIKYLAKRILASAVLVSTIGCIEIEEPSVEVISSNKDQVSGGTARIDVNLPTHMTSESFKLTLNGEDIKHALEQKTDSNALSGVVSGLNLGENTIKIEALDASLEIKPVELTLTNHPIEGPIFSGPHQQPFYCSNDDLDSLGLALPDENCMTPTKVSFLYMKSDGTYGEYTAGMDRPEDMTKTTTSEGKEVDFIVRWERGTINRFIYTIAALASESQDIDSPDLESWNKKLLFYFRGGTAIGHKQGSFSMRRSLYTEGLKRGYAVIFSTGTATKTHYNLQLGGETALMLKEHFIKKFAVPEFTVAIGASGGAVQQYMYAQNHKGLLDAIIPAMSYPDMVSQSYTAADCSLIENWIDSKLMTDPDSHWKDWTRRTLVTGFNASNEISRQVYAYGLSHPNIPNGASECTENWASLVPLVFNPLYGTAAGVSPEDQASTEWTHFADAKHVYGVGDDGYANRIWDNVGVQYGLSALVNNHITPEEFLDLNYNAGTLKQESDMIQEGCPYIIENCFAIDPTKPIWPQQVDIWGARNFLLSDGDKPAPRASADPGAIENAIAGGMVNRGDIQIPTIDVRINLEHKLDMHNTHQSFATRQRLINFDGDASNQSIWFVAVSDSDAYIDPIPVALDAMYEWMENISSNPDKTVGENRPLKALDTCFDPTGEVVATGSTVWDGILDKNKTNGACTQAHNIFSNTRMVAGSSIAGDTFQCSLQSIESAISAGAYGNWEPSIDQISTLKSIFPTGVCKY